MYSLARATTSKYSVLGHVGFDRHAGGQVGGRFGAAGGAGRFQRRHRFVQPRLAAGIGGLGVHALIGPDRRDDDDLVLHAVEDGGDGGPQQDGVGQAQRVGRRIGQIFHLPRHVIAQIAEQAGRHGRQAVRAASSRVSLRQGAQATPAAWRFPATKLSASLQRRCG